MKKFLMVLSILFLSLFTINVNAEEVLLCQYDNYKSNQEDNGSIYIYMDTSNGKWRLKVINNKNGNQVFGKYDNFDKVFSYAGVGKDVAITESDYNALKNSGTCPSSAIKTNIGSANVYFGSEAENIIANHTTRLKNANSGSLSYNWKTSADANTKSVVNSILTSGIERYTDSKGTEWVQACYYTFTKDGISGNVWIYRAPTTGNWKVVSDKGQGSAQFNKEGTFDYVFSTKSASDVMISDNDKDALLGGVCPEGALYNTGSGKNDVYIGSKARALQEGKDNIDTTSSGASNDHQTEETYKALNGPDAKYATVFDAKGHIGDDFCSTKQVMSALKVVGYFVLIMKLAIPFFIIGFSIFDLWKAVEGGDEKSMGTSAKKLGIRILIGISIFFVPSILHVVFSAMEGYNNIESDINICETCLLKPTECNVGGDIFDNNGGGGQVQTQAACSALSLESCGGRSDCTVYGGAGGAKCVKVCSVMSPSECDTSRCMVKDNKCTNK